MTPLRGSSLPTQEDKRAAGVVYDASLEQDTPMDAHPQACPGDPSRDEPLDLSPDVGCCHGCGQRRVLCAFGQCVACHAYSSNQGRRELPEPVGELCCGWFATGRLDAPWQCPTCGRVHG